MQIVTNILDSFSITCVIHEYSVRVKGVLYNFGTNISTGCMALHIPELFLMMMICPTSQITNIEYNQSLVVVSKPWLNMETFKLSQWRAWEMVPGCDQMGMLD